MGEKRVKLLSRPNLVYKARKMEMKMKIEEEG